MLTLVLRHFGFPDCIVDFSNYFMGGLTQYFWNLFLFSTYNTDIDIRQDSILSPTLSVLYIASLIHIFELRAQALIYFHLLIF